GVARFRVACFRTRKGPAAVFRLIPEEITPLSKLGVPEVVLRYTHLRSGLILVTGPTGSGKSTTLAAILDYINVNQKKHIVTIEEPIEFVHKNKKSFFTQREVGVDTDTFAAALRASSRLDPDVILVGELRDPETIGLAITAAETGYLVFATLHTNSAAKTVDRIIDVFEEEQQNQIRLMLSVTLKGVCAQQLLPMKDGKGRVPVNEILMGSTGLANNIREGSVAKIVSIIETGRGDGMQLMDDSILERYKQGMISAETAFLFGHHKQRLQHLAPKSA
ncbi:MAG TPA: PilT/PilU family type 4a pilus ATPase, partial [Planctomycetota bacterium]|nr:PilT/PilU family type 4a pilus ATPase [Planctomycetota bacterium]